MNKTRKILLIVAVVLLIAQLTLAIIEKEWSWSALLNISVPVMLIISFVIQIKQENKLKD